MKRPAPGEPGGASGGLVEGDGHPVSTRIPAPAQLQRPDFKRWLNEQADRGDWVGDLATDAYRDRRWPRGRPTPKRLEDYLLSRNACDGALRALREAWEEWQDEFPPQRLRDLEPGITLDLSDLAEDGQ